MTSRDDIYRKFGETSEAAQLLETELGNVLLQHAGASEGLLTGANPERAAEIVATVSGSTLGKLIRSLAGSDAALPELEDQLQVALDERNRLAHEFFRHHNFRINSDEGRTAMHEDLDNIHKVILDAYKALLRAWRGIDLDKPGAPPPPTKHVPI